MAQKRKSGNTVAAVAKLCEPFAQQLGLTIWDIRYVKEGSYWYLRIFIDKPEGVTLDAVSYTHLDVYKRQEVVT